MGSWGIRKHTLTISPEIVPSLVHSYSSSFGKTEYVRHKTITQAYSTGGYDALDFISVNNTFKINWLKHCVHQNNDPWFYIPNLLFLLSCNFKCSKLPVKLANFHKQALYAWKWAFNHNFSPHKCIIWNNQYVLYRNKSIFFSNWCKDNIIFILDLLNDIGDLYTLEKLTKKTGAHLSRKEYEKVVKSISKK